MIEFLRNHFSFTTPASVHDEESLTALELAGRQGAKINEVVDDQNKLRSETENHLATQDKDITTFKSNVVNNIIPDEVDKTVNYYIDNGTFEEDIDRKYSEIKEEFNTFENRVNNLLGSVTEGSTSGDAELIDARTDYSGQTYNNVGEAVRTVTKANFIRHRNFVQGAYGFSRWNIQPSAMKIDFTTDPEKSPNALFTPTNYFTMGSADINYTDVWNNRTSGATFVLRWERYAVGGALVMEELPLNVPTAITGDSPILAIIFIKNDKSILHVVCCDDLKNILYINGQKVVEDSITNDDLPDTIQLHMDEFKSAMIFENVMCIGDSFTSGHIETADGNFIESNPNFSYPYYMSKILGTNFINAGVSGFRISDMWNTDETASTRYNTINTIINEGGELPNAYLIGVALNDHSTSVGTNTDTVDSQTYMGGLYSLINNIRTLNPKAHIFVQTTPDSVIMDALDTAIMQTCNRFDINVHYLPLHVFAPYYNTAKLNASKVGNHYTAVGYQQFAQNLVYIWSKYINDNIDKFLEVHNPIIPDPILPLYEKLGINQDEYPNVVIGETTSSSGKKYMVLLMKEGECSFTSDSFVCSCSKYYPYTSNTIAFTTDTEPTNIYEVVDVLCSNTLSSSGLQSRACTYKCSSNGVYYTNTNVVGSIGTWYNF